MNERFLNRDISWLSFNGRVLHEAMRTNVPLGERFKFLSIFSSNLDEFYRVRMPVLMSFHGVDYIHADKYWMILQQAKQIIGRQLTDFGRVLREVLIPELQQHNIELIYNKPVPAELEPVLKEYFLSEITAFLEIAELHASGNPFFPKSNALYQAVFLETETGQRRVVLINIPSGNLSRFFSATRGNSQYIIFLDDILKSFLHLVFPKHTISGSWNIKITRDAELDLADEYDGDLAEKIEKQLEKRDDGSATRFLYEAGIPAECLHALALLLKIPLVNAVEGGSYHNLKDLHNLPVKNERLVYQKPASLNAPMGNSDSMFLNLLEKDRILHTPYHSYYPVLKFFNEAATDERVKEIYTTLYRVAGDSKIVNALITAAKNGKKVTVFIELKARFDEENNLRWSKRMKAAGVRIINSIPGLKVHAKVALVKRETENRMHYTALIATGNLNEVTARFYTDHILFTTNSNLVRELELLFLFLVKRRKPESGSEALFKHLLIAGFNLQRSFLEMIDAEIRNARQGKPSGIIIKMNNLEEELLIKKLYEASAAGVKVQMIVRSICCLAPGLTGLSENISIVRIVDRYLEHGRVFLFTNGGDEKMFIGSADWMNRNIYRRIEVCTPVYDKNIKEEIKHILLLQLKDNMQAVEINAELNNQPIHNHDQAVQSQMAIYEYLRHKQSV
ncbi:MAG: polyphosphate kinase 1 [Ferruginibacter sp.]|nr:polyphosphate kinase 1 [Ferruginibacter sp.]